MEKYYSPKYKTEIINILPGEYAVSSDVALTTVLGSCVSVVLYCASKRIGGLNHFMLPQKTGEDINLESKSGKYGMAAMELLINALIKKGVRKEELAAQVFGGSSMFGEANRLGKRSIGQINIDFATFYLEEENIPIVGQNVGGEGGHKITFFPTFGSILVSNLRKEKLLVEQEKKYAKELLNEDGDKIILF